MKLLLVEDEFIIAAAERRELESLGYQVLHAGSGEAALGLVDADPTIDLVLMDIDLGKGMDGTEAGAEILRKHDLPLMFVSSHAEKAIVERTERITNYGYVAKNSGVAVLDASIKMAVKLFESNRNNARINMELAAANETLRVTVESLQEATTLGIIVNEFVTNSFKYAFTDISEPRIRIELSELEDLLVLRYEDNGPGPDPGKISGSGFGMRLVGSLVEQLSGCLHTGPGALFEIKFRPEHGLQA